MAEPLNPALRAVSDAVLAVTSRHSVDDVLQGLVDRARELAGARYAALGTPDGAGGFRRFLVSGMAPELIESMGPLPRTHGVLGAMLETPEPYRTGDIHEHPRFRGWWPDRHPDMRSFLGVPIVGAEGVMGAFYLTHKEDAGDFDDADEQVIGLLAAHAAIAITNARLYENANELSVLAERNRLALELHDVVVQKLFSLVLTADAAGTLLDSGAPAEGRAQLARAQGLASEALDELRVLIGQLRPPDLGTDGLASTLRKHVDVTRRLHGIPIALEVDPDAGTGDEDRDREVLRIAQEALHNAVRHAEGANVAVRLLVTGGGDRDGNSPDGDADGGGGGGGRGRGRGGRGRGGGGGGGGGGRGDGRCECLVLEVADDGAGFDPADPALRGTHLGLTSMEERAARIGATIAIDSGAGGTTVRVAVPHA